MRDHIIVIVLAAAIAWLKCRDLPGSWNDSSRLATVEAIVDRQTFIIDDSIFVNPPARSRLPGTMDKLFIRGHFYSDKSPVPAILMAGEYWLWQHITSKTAVSDTRGFCRFLTLASSGIAYVVAVWCIFALGGALWQPRITRFALTGSFALATIAPVYAQQVNSHVVLLAFSAALSLGVICLQQRRETGRSATGWLIGLGTLTGLGYTMDLGVGPALLVCTAALVGWRTNARGLLLFVVAALPWLALHHGVNYAIGGTWKPANAVADYLNYPGSPFSADNMTGNWKHTHPGEFLVYLASLLFGKKGFVGHNLGLFLAFPAVIWLLRRKVREWPEVLWAVAWSGGTWLLYGAASNNSAGLCCSIRWFVPLLAPGYMVLALDLRDRPEQLKPFVLLSAASLTLSAWLMIVGPWQGKMVPYFWPVQGVALIGWGWISRRVANPAAREVAERKRIAA
jgi:hypothetical protein